MPVGIYKHHVGVKANHWKGGKKKCEKCGKEFSNHKPRKTGCCRSCGRKYKNWSIKGLKWSLTARKKASVARKGIKITEEHRLKIQKYQRSRVQLGIHNNYKGDDVGYRGLHHWINRWLGKPKKCEHCGKDNLVGRQIHWANKSGKYLRDTTDWLRLCVKCHKKHDKR